eukprot:SAG31_NODE_58_length_29669_cov_20.244978_8_plen_196_part_00
MQLFEKYGSLIERCTALIEKVSSFRAKFARDAVGTNEFMTLDNTGTYAEWLEYHFFYGLGNVSYRAMDETNGTVILVGPPRIRQHRAGRRCAISSEWSNFKSRATCWDGSYEEEGDAFQSENENFTFKYCTAKELEEVAYSTKMQTYSGNGYILQNVSRLMRRAPTRHTGATELYQYAHSRLDADDLTAISGWLR